MGHTIGIIGGMGPLASADFVLRLVRAIPAHADTDHPRLLLDSNPHVPDRNAAIAGGASPGPVLAAMAQGLVGQGATLLAMPCNAAHGWAGDITAAVAVPFVSIIDAATAAALAHRPARVGLIAVGATLDARLYHDRLAAAEAAVLTPPRAAVATLVGRVKAGDTGPAVRAAMAELAVALVADGADVIIAACTEVPLVLAQADVAVPLVDSLDALVAAVVARLD